MSEELTECPLKECKISSNHGHGNGITYKGKRFPELHRAEMENIFTYHAPFGDQVQRYEAIRAAGLDFANVLLNLVPKTRERDVALDKVREAVMWANAAIACNETEAGIDTDEHDHGAEPHTHEGGSEPHSHTTINFQEGLSAEQVRQAIQEFDQREAERRERQ